MLKEAITITMPPPSRLPSPVADFSCQNSLPTHWAAHSDAGSIIGKISVGAAMQPIEIDQVVNGKPQSAVMPAVGTVPGPDVIVGELA